jgi:hypothetical protein
MRPGIVWQIMTFAIGGLGLYLVWVFASAL